MQDGFPRCFGRKEDAVRYSLIGLYCCFRAMGEGRTAGCVNEYGNVYVCAHIR